MDHKAVPAPSGKPSVWQQFRGGFLQVRNELRGEPPLLTKACPYCWIIGRVALVGAVVIAVAALVLSMYA